jgi:hypothetical protein
MLVRWEFKGRRRESTCLDLVAEDNSSALSLMTEICKVVSLETAMNS